MKKNKVLFLLLLILCGVGCSAQPFKLIKATRQRWSGGVVGRSGIYYTISIQTSLKNAAPDTVWINNIAYPLDFAGKNNAYKSSFDSITNKITYSISAEEEHNELNMRPYPMKKDSAKKAQAAIVKPVRQFKGAALISYRHKHKQRFFTINSFTDLKPLNYP